MHVDLSPAWGEKSPESLSGAAAVGSHGVTVSLRRDESRAVLVIGGGQPRGQPLPDHLQGVDSAAIHGVPFETRPVQLESAEIVLRGIVPFEAAAGLFPAAPAEAPASGLDPDADDQVVALSRQHAAAKRERKQHADRVKDLQSKQSDLQSQLQAIESELAGAGESSAALAERCAELRQRIREGLDAEEA